MANLKKFIRKISFLPLILCCGGILTQTVSAQVGLKTNVVYDLTATANLGAEVVVAPRWALDVSGNLNAWDINRHKWKLYG